MKYSAGSTQVAVIGAGHAGIEAALAAARRGCSTILFTLNLDAIGNMPCNPSIGGSGKGHLVFEIDALGGEMGKTADMVCLQSRMLNLGKGPAVHSLRMQADRARYHTIMKKTCENCEGLDIIQGEIVELEHCDDGTWNVTTRYGATWNAKAVVIASGTYLRGKIIVGDVSYSGGPDGMFPAGELTESLKKIGVPLMRFKTGTPARIHADSVDYSQMEKQYGDETPEHFSYHTKDFSDSAHLPCYVIYTNAETHRIIRENLHRSPLYSGQIEGTGPRYCPSIEDKVVRFADKERHQLFLEPMGIDTKEMYLQGFSSSMPEDVQMQMIHSLKGLENCKVMRTAYAIEYDYADPLSLEHTLEFKDFPGLFGAGQFNGTSGYEEAAAQGLVAGINAASYVLGVEKLTLSRDSSYIGTLIDDLVTKGTREPYRIMTSRSEYRLLIRQDNADERLTPIGYRFGLISEERYTDFCRKRENIKNEIERVKGKSLAPSDILEEILESANSAPVKNGINMAELLRRPEISYKALAKVDPFRPELSETEMQAVEVEIKYEGYIKRQLDEAARMAKLEEKLLPDGIDYSTIDGLRLEARQKLNAVRPKNIGQASRISGVSPADVSVLLVYLEGCARERKRKDN
ncbi:MAG: tRNA uridine-5-carboxymethylaminomethyl(34) synthesis enzyme MnmG [Clostridia bacterium]|nr:tRNA uridine-5-carboxymethylaminomethyl(34) synthesis enzyme MnmG [Clostridia bacterium]